MVKVVVTFWNFVKYYRLGSLGDKWGTHFEAHPSGPSQTPTSADVFIGLYASDFDETYVVGKLSLSAFQRHKNRRKGIHIGR